MGYIGTIITIILIVAWVVKGLAALTGNDEASRDKRGGRSLEDWDQMQSRRRAELQQQQQERAHELEELEVNAMPGQQAPQPVDMSHLTMAQRIELARERARQQAGTGGSRDEAGEALRQARMRAEQEAQERSDIERRRAMNQREELERERARLERERQTAKRRAAERAREKAEDQRRQAARAGKRRKPVTDKHRPQQVPVESMRTQSYARVHEGHGHDKPTVTILPKAGALTAKSLKPLNVAALRKAIVMKELLDKPLAMRNPQDDLLF